MILGPMCGSVSFPRLGPSALLCSGLPLSSSVVIERSFMYNMFQFAFVNHQSPKRRYMFSVDDPVMWHNWTVSLKWQIEIVSAGQQAQVAPPLAESWESKCRRAASEFGMRSWVAG
jgi:hypothetical protein